MNRHKLILTLAIAAVVLLASGETLLAGSRGTTIIAKNSNVYVITNGQSARGCVTTQRRNCHANKTSVIYFRHGKPVYTQVLPIYRPVYRPRCHNRHHDNRRHHYRSRSRRNHRSSGVSFTIRIR